jgi:hypothetical protein
LRDVTSGLRWPYTNNRAMNRKVAATSCSTKGYGVIMQGFSQAHRQTCLPLTNRLYPYWQSYRLS